MELFRESKWFGEFFVNNDYDRRFQGEILYSPEKGIKFSYSISTDTVPENFRIVHGILMSGDKCTLIGEFAFEQSGFVYKNGLRIRNGTIGFQFLVIGDFLAEEEPLYNIDFSLTNLQEFFFAKGYKDFVKHSQEPLFSISADYGKIEVATTSSFGFLHNDISGSIYSNNDTALEELNESFRRIKNKFPESTFMLKKDISYRIYIEISAGKCVKDAYQHINDIANLFSILIYCPVYPDSIRATKRVKEIPPISLSIYPSIALEKKTMNLCVEDRSHFLMPITASSIDLASSIEEWLKSPNVYSAMVSSIQHETGYRTRHSLYGELILYATQIEAVSNTESIENSKRYEYPIDKYGSPKIREGIAEVFGNTGETSIGKGISRLRNEIAHVGKPKELLNILSIEDMIRLTRYLQMTILGYILDRLKIEKDIISHYQNKFTFNA